MTGSPGHPSVPFLRHACHWPAHNKVASVVEMAIVHGLSSTDFLSQQLTCL